jgi:hypothetical protein
MRAISKLVLIPLVFVVGVALVVSVVSLYRGLVENDTQVMASAVAGFGLNGVLLVLGLRGLRRTGWRLRRPKPVLGTRSLRLQKVGSVPRIALF